MQSEHIMNKEGFVKLFCVLLIAYTFRSTHANTEKDFDLFNSLKDVENYSDISADACNSVKDCNNLGECINVAGRKICNCDNGLSGENCEIIDECNENSGICGTDGDSECFFHRTKKRASCKCKEKGKRFDVQTKKCVLQKPCLTQEQCHNGGLCLGDDGGKYCVCGYGTSGDFCDMIDECVSNPDLCSGDAECKYSSLLLRAVCYCSDINQRFDLTSKSCVNRTECKSNEDCKNYGRCSNRCQPWEPCNYTDTENKHSCHCVEGTSGQNCEVIDDCLNKIVDCGTSDKVTCKYFYNIGVERYAYCECANSIQEFDGLDKTCKDCNCGTESAQCYFKKGIKVCKCESDEFNFGDRCEDCKCGKGSKGCNFKNEVKECFCDPGYKEFNGTCEKCDCGSKSTDCKFEEDGRKVCTCEPGFKVGNYSVCTPMCNDKLPCTNGGRCLQDICECLAGTGGPYCKKIYDCENKLCGDKDDVQCRYDRDTQRAYCECNIVQHTYDSYDKSCKKCSCGESLGRDWERCDFVLGKKVCQCSEGYAYNPKAEKCLECECGNSSKTCSFEDKGEKNCQCLKGYIDDLGTCKECECGPNGKCSFYSNGNFSKCLCDSGFSENSGKCVFCDCGPKSKCSFQNKRKMCTCAKGYMDDKGYCADIDECLNTEACPGPGTLCENTLGSYKCRCQLGYQGRSPTKSDRKTLCEKIGEAKPNYKPWKIGYALLSVGFIVIIAGLAYVIFRMQKSLKISASNIALRNRN